MRNHGFSTFEKLKLDLSIEINQNLQHKIKNWTAMNL